jgi:hypothetical protein
VSDAGLGLTLEQGLSLSGMSFEELWLDQLAVGGDAGRLEVEAYVRGLLVADPLQHDVIAQALNESLLEQGLDHLVGYWHAATTD